MLTLQSETRTSFIFATFNARMHLFIRVHLRLLQLRRKTRNFFILFFILLFIYFLFHFLFHFLFLALWSTPKMGLFLPSNFATEFIKKRQNAFKSIISWVINLWYIILNNITFGTPSYEMFFSINYKIIIKCIKLNGIQRKSFCFLCTWKLNKLNGVYSNIMDKIKYIPFMNF